MTGLSYKTEAFERADRAKQLELLGALGAWDRALRRDECGAWVIKGNGGTIVSWSDRPGETAWHLAYMPGEPEETKAGEAAAKLAWTYAKRMLGFCTVVQNGDWEGCFKLDHLPNAEEGELIRRYLGIRKRAEYSPEELERRRASMANAAEAAHSARELSEALG